jgi:hypothetical protein
MKLQDLKTGMLVQTNDGNWRVVVRGICDTGYSYAKDRLVAINDGFTFVPLDKYYDDLIGNCSDWTINKVATIHYALDVFRGTNSVETLNGFKVIWQRKTDQEEQLENLINDLQNQLNNAQEKLKEIRG